MVCVRGAISAPDRAPHSARIRRLFRESVVERQKVSEGYAFRFTADEIEEIGRFVAQERKCCPFLEFSLDIAARDGPVWLVITGPRGSQAIIEAELLQ